MSYDIANQMELLASEVEWELPIHVSGLLNDGAAEIRSLREAVRVLGEALSACNELRQKGSTMTYTTKQTKSSAFGPLWAAVNANPIAAAAVEAARNQTKGTQ